MWMNEWEIDNAVERWWNHGDLGPAVRTLNALRETANANSDGWAYWPKPAHAAAKLMSLIQAHELWENDGGDHPHRLPQRGKEATTADLRKALAPVKAFRTRMIRQMTERYDAAQGARWNFTITERLPTRREELITKIQRAERSAREHAAAADRWQREASDLYAELAECQECGCPS